MQSAWGAGMCRALQTACADAYAERLGCHGTRYVRHGRGWYVHRVRARTARGRRLVSVAHTYSTEAPGRACQHSRVLNPSRPSPEKLLFESGGRSPLPTAQPPVRTPPLSPPKPGPEKIAILEAYCSFTTSPSAKSQGSGTSPSPSKSMLNFDEDGRLSEAACTRMCRDPSDTTSSRRCRRDMPDRQRERNASMSFRRVPRGGFPDGPVPGLVTLYVYYSGGNRLHSLVVT